MKEEVKLHKEVQIAQQCFLENVTEPCFSWKAAWNSYVNYIETMHNYCKDKEDERFITYEARRCTELLERKKIDPKSIGTSFVIYKKTY